MTLYHCRGNGENIINDKKVVKNCCPGLYFKVTHRQSDEASSKGNISSKIFVIDKE